MSARRLLLCLFISITGIGCSSPYKADYEPDHDFTSYRTYRWLEPNEPVMDALASNPLLKKRFMNAVDRVLQEQGYVPADSNEPDFYVHVQGTVQQRMRVDDGVSVSYGYYGRYGGMGVRHMDVSYYDEGTLILDIIDRPMNELVWRGWVTQVIRDYQDPRQAEAAVEKAVRGILANFPPAPVQ
jgi:hypothetical protein